MSQNVAPVNISCDIVALGQCECKLRLVNGHTGLTRGLSAGHCKCVLSETVLPGDYITVFLPRGMPKAL